MLPLAVGNPTSGSLDGKRHALDAYEAFLRGLDHRIGERHADFEAMPGTARDIARLATGEAEAQLPNAQAANFSLIGQVCERIKACVVCRNPKELWTNRSGGTFASGRRGSSWRSDAKNKL